MLAFTVPAVGAIQGYEIEAEKPRLPQFKPRWWYKQDRLDARPVVWSLRNRPDEWIADHPGYTIMHKPSHHRFWVASGRGFYGLYEAGCSCNNNRGRFQRFQQGLFGRAYKQWRAQSMAGVDQQFAEHFIH